MALYIRLTCEVLTDAKMFHVGPEAAFVWVRGLLYAKQHMTDGFVPIHALELVAIGTRVPAEDVAAALVAANLWRVVDGGWHVGHDRWARHQTTAQDIERIRESWRERKRLQKERHAGITRESRVKAGKFTPPEPEPEPEQKKEKKPPAKEAGGKEKTVRVNGPRTPRTPLRLPDDDPVLNAQDRAYAIAKHVPDPDAVWEHFLSYHRAKGTALRDWAAGWRTWVLNESRFTGRVMPNGNGQPPGRLTAAEKSIAAARRVLTDLAREDTDQ